MNKIFFKISCMVLMTVFLLLTACATAPKYGITPLPVPVDFEVVSKYGVLFIEDFTDNRPVIDKKGTKIGKTFLGPKAKFEGTLGDEDYKDNLLSKVNSFVLEELYKSDLFETIMQEGEAKFDWNFGGSLDRFSVNVDEKKARIATAFMGGFAGLIGASISAKIDIMVVTEITLTGWLRKNGQDVWHKTVTTAVTKSGPYGMTGLTEIVPKKSVKLTEDCIAEAIGKCTKELITEMAIYLAESE